jgi:glycosyltransferase involved in cell wall biosynthesis
VSGEKPRLWVVSELYYPEETSTGYFITRIAEGLTDVFDVRVVAGRSGYSARSMTVQPRETRHGVAIRRLWTPHFDKDRLAMRFVSALILTCGVFLHLLFRLRPRDLVLAVTNPPMMPLVAVLAARLRGAKSVLLVHDVYPEILRAAGFLSSRSWIYRLLSLLFATVYRLFASIVVIGRDMEEVVRGKLGGKPPPIVFIPNWGDTAEVKPVAENVFRKEHGLQGKFILQFSGNIGRTHDIEAVIDLAERLRGIPLFHFLIVGDGGKQNWLQAKMTQSRLENVTILPRQPRERLNHMLAASNVTMIAMVDGMFGLSVPSRLYNVMAAGVPVIAIADSRSELSRTVVENHAGWTIAPGDRDALMKLALSLQDSAGWEEARRRGANARRVACECYTEGKIVSQYRALLLGLRAH